MKIADILNWDMSEFISADRRSLAQATSLLARAANKRVQRLQRLEIESPALKALKKTGSIRFTTARKNLNQLREEFTRAKHFLESKTSTVTKFREIERDTYKRLGFEGTPSAEIRNSIWDVYHELENTESTLLKEYGSGETQKLVADIVKGGKDFTTALNETKAVLQKSYEEKQIEDFDGEDVFTFGGYNPFN